VAAQDRDLMAKYLSPRTLNVLCSVIFLLVKVTNANVEDVKSIKVDLPKDQGKKFKFWDGGKSQGGDQCSGPVCPAELEKLGVFGERECKGTCPCGDLLDEFTCVDYNAFHNHGVMGFTGIAIAGNNDRELTGVPNKGECERICLWSHGLNLKSYEYAAVRGGWCACSSKAPGDPGVTIVKENGVEFCLRKCKKVSNPVTKPTAKGIYLGCFKERDDNRQPYTGGWQQWPYTTPTPAPLGPRDIYEQQHNLQTNSRDICVSKCYEGGFKYAGLQFNRCFCGNSFGSYGSAKESDCNVPCPILYHGTEDWNGKVNKTNDPNNWKHYWYDHASDKCGGFSEHRGDRVENSVYWTGVDDPQRLMFSSRKMGPPAASVAGRVRRSLGGLVAVLVFCYALVRCRF